MAAKSIESANPFEFGRAVRAGAIVDGEGFETVINAAISRLSPKRFGGNAGALQCIGSQIYTAAGSSKNSRYAQGALRK
ncbi:MAG: hypothetical protein ACLPV8_24550 [Steroidobacteraceae bacterium]